MSCKKKKQKTALFWSTSEAIGLSTLAHRGERLRRVFLDPACITAWTVLPIYVCVPCTRARFDVNRNLIPHFLLISSSSNSPALCTARIVYITARLRAFISLAGKWFNSIQANVLPDINSTSLQITLVFQTLIQGEPNSSVTKKMRSLVTEEADDSSASVEAEEKQAGAEAEEVEEQKEVEDEVATDKEEDVKEPEQEVEKQREEEAEEDSGILSDKERQNEEVNEKDNCSASSISSASSTLEREERVSTENGG